MGKHGRNRNKHSHSHGPDHDSTKLLRYAARGRVKKLRKFLRHVDRDALLDMSDAMGAGALHQACRYGHLEAVSLLLRHHADPNAVDSAGNTPGHLAAMHGHLVVLAELIKRAQPSVDLDLHNTAGLSIRDIINLREQQQQQQQHTPSTDTPAGSDSDSDHRDSTSNTYGSSRGVNRRRAAAIAVDDDNDGAGNAAVADDEAWNARLAEEMSDDEGWGNVFRQNWSTAAAAAAGRHGKRAAVWAGAASRCGVENDDGSHLDDTDDDEDAWADRLWEDMQDHRRRVAQEAAAARAKQSSTHRQGFMGDREAAAGERKRRAAAAAAESERILREEQAKDADWRTNMMRQIEEAAFPSRRSMYEQKWSALDSWPADRPITYDDIPWPIGTSKPSSAAGTSSLRSSLPQQHNTELQIDSQQLHTLVFYGANGPAALKAALRKELMRWHPDKFGARFGARLLDGDKEVILAGVQAVAQQVTALKEA